MKSIKKQLQMMSISDLKWICRELGIKYNNNKNSIIKHLLLPLSRKYNMFGSILNYVAPRPQQKHEQPILIITFEQMKDTLQDEKDKKGNNIFYMRVLIKPMDINEDLDKDVIIKNGKLYSEEVKLIWSETQPINENQPFIFRLKHEGDNDFYYTIPVYWAELAQNESMLRSSLNTKEWEIGSAS